LQSNCGSDWSGRRAGNRPQVPSTACFVCFERGPSGAGGFQAGRPWAAAASTLLLALGFLGLAHALLETTVGKARRRVTAEAPGLRTLAAASVLLLLGLAAAGLWLPGSDIVDALARGLS
jgi:hypothetical protein